MSAKARVGNRAARQFGRIGAWQLAELGVAGGTIASWLDTGYLHRLLPRVFAVGHHGRSREGDLAAALLYAGPGAMLSHATAAHWRGLLDAPPTRIHVSTPRRCLSLPGITVHARRDLPRRNHKGLPTTSLPQLFLDLAATEPRQTVRHALANAEYHRILDLSAVDAALGSGRPGSATLRAALKNHQPKLAHTRSRLEQAFIALCERAAIPVPQMNVRLAGWLVDAVWHDCRLVVEVDGHGNHHTPAQRRRDRRKELVLRSNGYATVRYSEDLVFDEPAAVTADLLRARAERRAA